MKTKNKIKFLSKKLKFFIWNLKRLPRFLFSIIFKQQLVYEVNFCWQQNILNGMGYKYLNKRESGIFLEGKTEITNSWYIYAHPKCLVNYVGETAKTP